MKFNLRLGLLGIGMLTMSSSCQRDNDASPTPLTTGRLVKTQLTWASNTQNSRPRWIVDIAPLSFEGNWPGHTYPVVKVFDLPDTATYKAGKTISFRYQVVPPAQQTPWKTGYEWNNVAPQPGGAEPFAELRLSDVQLL